ncbi:MAG: ribonuclease H [Bacteroidaceae bacterium]|nr:ribonuclease H [Bacteroidaceae bacterium]MBR1666040.1 ribonuclease H [Bacteroidaceae bacterium]
MVIRYKSFALTGRKSHLSAYPGPCPGLTYRCPCRALFTCETGVIRKINKIVKLISPPDYRHDTVLPLPMEVPAEAIAVDAACSGNPGPMEYRGIYLKTGQEIFHFGPVHGTNNIGEFLAIVHAMALMKQKGVSMPVYSDSRTAIIWVTKRKAKTTLAPTPENQPLLQLVARAENWLRQNGTPYPLHKWETEKWGEVPADFGRK